MEHLKVYSTNGKLISNKKQSSIEWLYNTIDYEIVSYLDGEIDLNELSIAMLKIKEQAKAMHKEEIERFNKFLNDEKKLGIADLKTIERIQWYYNTYFNETFGGNNE